MMTNRKILLIPVFTVLLSGLCFAEETVYVQSYKVKLHIAPKISSATLLTLDHGAKLTVIKKQKNWYQVSFGKKTGWVYVYSVVSQPLGKQDSLLKNLSQQGGSNKPRRQPSSIPTTAVIRGLDGAENKGSAEDTDNKLED